MALDALIQILDDSVFFLLLVFGHDIQRCIHFTHFDESCGLIVILLEFLEDATEILL